MANVQESQEFEIEDLVADRKQPKNIAKQGDPDTDVTTKDDSEPVHKHKGLPCNVCCLKVRSKFKGQRYCLCSSKAVILILIWNLIVSFSLVGFLDPSLYSFSSTDETDVDFDTRLSTQSDLITFGLSYSFSAFLHLFYPLAGWLADVRWGRYTTVVNSLYFTFWSMVLMIAMITMALVASFPFFISETDSLSILQIATIVTVSVVLGLPVLAGAILLICSLVAFSANVIQFGIDQLRDAPTDDSVLYIYWYLWTSYAGSLIIRIPLAATLNGLIGLPISSMLIAFAPVFLGITLCLKCCKNKWFLIDPGSKNPYRLVFQVVKFASDHKIPIHRSAFTYCEDELPSRIDLGKDKYGGPFKTEQVEDVKAFLGILSVLLATGPAFLADIAVNGALTGFIKYTTTTYMYSGNFTDNFTDISYNAALFTFYGSGCVTPLIIVILIPVYLFLLRPFIYDYIPGMLKRMGMGMTLLLISGLCTLLMGVADHDCSSEEELCQINTYFAISPHFLIIQFCLNAVGYMLLYTAIYEFICAQSPYSMKGLLIGTHFAIKGVFQLLGVLFIYTPISTGCNYHITFPICGFVYFLANTLVALIGLIAFIFVARKYGNRQRDEPDNIYRYAEEYYANDQSESSISTEYYNYDNLKFKVETIKT